MTLLLLHLVRNGLVFTRVVYWMTPYFGGYTFYLIGPYFWFGVCTYLSLQIGSAPPPGIWCKKKRRRKLLDDCKQTKSWMRIKQNSLSVHHSLNKSIIYHQILPCLLEMKTSNLQKPYGISSWNGHVIAYYKCKKNCYFSFTEHWQNQEIHRPIYMSACYSLINSFTSLLL